MAKRTARPWEVWDRPGVAEQVDAYWLSSSDEQEHRKRLARLVQDELGPGVRSVLEVGCGTGLVYGALREAIGPTLDYYGLDNSGTMLALMRRRFPGVKTKKGDGFALPFEDTSFDLACAFEVLGHMPDASGALAELWRVARRRVLFTLWLGAEGDPEAGGEHYLYSAEWVVRQCQVIRKPGTTLTLRAKHLPPVHLFTLELAKGGAS